VRFGSTEPRVSENGGPRRAGGNILQRSGETGSVGFEIQIPFLGTNLKDSYFILWDNKVGLVLLLIML
jgi:hypothetical protein